jgi:hypothetical protein
MSIIHWTSLSCSIFVYFDLLGFIMKNKEVYFKFLDALRESGLTNMFGAAPYLAGSFSLSNSEAREILQEWMTLPKFKNQVK